MVSKIRVRTFFFLASLAITHSAHARPTIKVITDVVIPATTTNPTSDAGRAMIPVPSSDATSPGVVFSCPTGFERTNWSGQFAICKQNDNWCRGRRPICVRKESVDPDAPANLDSSKTVVTRLFLKKNAVCPASSILAGKIPDCEFGRCNQGTWSICAKTESLNLRQGGLYLSNLILTTHGLHVNTPPCNQGIRSISIVDGGNGYLNGHQTVCEMQATLARRNDAPVVPIAIKILNQPQNYSVRVSPAKFHVKASINSVGRVLNYQWQKSPNGTAWSDIAGATAPDLVEPITPLQFNTPRKIYYRVVVNSPPPQRSVAVEPVTSEVAQLSILGGAPSLMPARITCDKVPQSVTLNESLFASFSTSCSVNLPNATLAYQWQIAPSDSSVWSITGQNSPTLNLQFAQREVLTFRPTMVRVKVSVSTPSTPQVTPLTTNKVLLSIPNDLAGKFPATISMLQYPSDSALFGGRAKITAVAEVNRSEAITFRWQTFVEGPGWVDIAQQYTWASVETEGTEGEPYRSALSINVAGTDSVRETFATNRFFRVVVSSPAAPPVTTGKTQLRYQSGGTSQRGDLVFF